MLTAGSIRGTRAKGEVCLPHRKKGWNRVVAADHGGGERGRRAIPPSSCPSVELFCRQSRADGLLIWEMSVE